MFDQAAFLAKIKKSDERRAKKKESKRKEIETLLDTYVNDNFKLIVSKLELGRKFNDNKQMLKTKVLDYFIERNHILS